MERHLRTFVNYQQDDWSEKPAMAKFAANNNELASTKLSPFYATKGLHPHMSFDIVDFSNTSTRKRIFKQKALEISRNMETTWEFVQKAMAVVQKSQLKQADKHRTDISYTVRDKVWLSIRNITMDQLSKKLDHKMLGPFKVIRNKGVLVELQPPQSMKIHNVFHPNLLQKASTDLLTNEVNEAPPPVIINNEEEWEVEDILDAKSHRGKLQYQVKWVGWDEDREWYNPTGFENSPKIIEDFHSRYSNKPKSGKPAARKSEKKRGWKFRIFFYMLKKPCV